MSSKSTKNFPELIPVLAQLNEPAWFFALRQAAFHKLSSTPFPNSSLESWRKLKWGNFSLSQYLGGENSFHTKLHHTDKSLEIKSLVDANEFQKQMITNHLRSVLDSKENVFFQLLCIAFNQSVSFLNIPDQYETKEPLFLESSFRDFSPSGFQLFFSFLGKNSHVTLVHKSIPPFSETIHLFNSLNFTDLGQGSSCQELQIEEFTPSIFHIRTFDVSLQRDSQYRSGYFNLGGFRGKTFFSIHLKEPGSSAKLLGVASPAKKEIQDLEYSISHESGHTSSELKFKTVMKDKSHHIFTGNLHIPKTSKQVEATQLNNNLILDSTSRAESMPKLEVFAEDVKCSHGATMSEIQEDQLFYLLSRGFTPKDAKHLIVDGFLSEIIDEFPMESTMDLKDKLLRKLGD